MTRIILRSIFSSALRVRRAIASGLNTLEPKNLGEHIVIAKKGESHE